MVNNTYYNCRKTSTTSNCTWPDTTKYEFKCACGKGWTGPQCDQDVNECNSTGVVPAPPPPCGLNGVCNNTLGSYFCMCNPGYTGKLYLLEHETVQFFK